MDLYRTPVIFDVVIDGQRCVYIQDREGTDCGRASTTSYQGGCRCDACRDKWNEYNREARRGTHVDGRRKETAPAQRPGPVLTSHVRDLIDSLRRDA